MFKKVFCFMSVVLLMACLLSVTSVAARTGEFETNGVEFDVITPDDLLEPVEIHLTEKNQGYVLSYYVHKLNNYFSNEDVPIGEYSVKVVVLTDDKDEEFHYIYKKDLIVETSSTAIPFQVIIDRDYSEVDDNLDGEDSSADEDGWYDDDWDDEEDPGNEDEDLPDDNDLDEDITETKKDSGKNTNKGKSDSSLLFSLLFSVALIAIAAGVMYWLKKRQ